MHPHLAEVMAEAWLHKGPCLIIQWLPLRTHHLMHNPLDIIHRHCTYCCPLHHPLALLAALDTFTASNSVLTTGAFALQKFSLQWHKGLHLYFWQLCYSMLIHSVIAFLKPNLIACLTNLDANYLLLVH